MKYFINTYGCQMNVHDSEKIAGILEAMNYQLAEDQQSADIVVFNTCCIRETDIGLLARNGPKCAPT